MKPYISVMQEFIGKKFGKLSSELLLKKYMQQMGITNLLALTHEQQVRFSNFFIDQVLQRHMDAERIGLMKSQLVLKYCLDNALEKVGQTRQKVGAHFSTAQLSSPGLALEGKDKNDLFFHFTLGKPCYIILGQQEGVALLNALSGTKKELFEPGMYDTWKPFLEDVLREFVAVYKQMKNAELSFSVPEYKDGEEHLSALREKEENSLYVADMELLVQGKKLMGRFICLR